MMRGFTKSITFITVFLVATICHPFDTSGYITIDKYLDDHQEQKLLMKSFSDIVSSYAIPIGFHMNRNVKIAAVYPGIQKSNYWRDSVTSMEKRLDELGIRYETARFFSKPSGDFRLQVKQFADAIKAGSDYITISVDNENMKRLVSTVLAKKKPKIFIQNLTTPTKEWQSNPPYMYVGFDHVEGAKIIADQYSKIFPKGASYILLYGPKGTVSSLRGGGFESYALAKGFTPAAKFYTDFDADKAYNAVNDALKRFPNISFIYACSTDIAIGASRALEELGLLNKVIVNGWGGTLKELNLIKQNKLDFTVMRMNDDNGVAIAEAIKLDLINNADMAPQIFSGEFVTVTKEMTNEAIDSLIERALRYSKK